MAKNSPTDITRAESKELIQVCDNLYDGISKIITSARQNVAAYVNAQASMMFWHIGHYINEDLNYLKYSAYGNRILATLSQRLTATFGKGFTYSALTRMMNVAQCYTDESMFATLSQTLSWSHFLELITIEDSTKRLFYQQMAQIEHWSLRTLRKKQDSMDYERSLIAAKPENEANKVLAEISAKHMEPDVVLKNSYILDFLGLNGYYSEEELEDAIITQLESFILELGQGFAFLERQKRFTVDGTDYYLDLLFYHRRLKCLVAIDLKLGKFKPQYKGQMELYLKYLQKHDMQEGENPPIGLLLCSEGNTEHIELLMLDEPNIKVGQYLTYLPEKQWFLDKLSRSILIAKEHKGTSLTGILLDGESYSLKVGHANQSGVTLSGASKVLTNQICDANGKNCKNVSQLSTGGTPGNGTITIKQGTTTVGSFNLNDSASKTLTLSSGGTTPGNGTITIKQGTTTIGSFNLNDSTSKTLTLSSGGTTPGNGTITIKQGTTTIGSFNLNDSASKTLTLSSGGTTPGNGKIIIKQGGTVKGSFTLNQSSDNTIELDAGGSGGDSLRQEGSLTYGPANKQTKVDYVTPKDSRVIYLSQSRPNIYFGDGEQNSKLRFLNYGTNRYVTTAAEIRPNGATFGLVDSAIQSSLAGVSIAGYLIVGNSGQNYIGIYSTGTIGQDQDDNRRYEIMASKELAVGTYGGSFIYFKNHNNGNDYKQYRVGINNREPKATLDVAGSIRINTEGNKVCAPSNCTGGTAGTIIYRDNSFYGCMSKDGGRTYNRYKFTTETNPTNFNRSINCSTLEPVSNDGADY